MKEYLVLVEMTTKTAYAFLLRMILETKNIRVNIDEKNSEKRTLRSDLV